MAEPLFDLRWSVVLRPSGRWEAARVLLVRGKPFTLLPARLGSPCSTWADARALAVMLNLAPAESAAGENGPMQHHENAHGRSA